MAARDPRDAAAILAANAEDVAEARGRRHHGRLHRPADARRRRARGDGRRRRGIAALPDPVGDVTERWTRPNGLTIERVRDAARRHRRHLREPPQRHGRCRRAVPQGGQCRDPARRLGQLPLLAARSTPPAARACAQAGLPSDAIQLVPTRDRAAVGAMLAGLDGNIDVIVPRGGKSLVARVQEEARVPVFAHLEGICHVYVDRRRRSRDGEDDRAQRQDAAHRRLRRGRDPARRPRRRRRRI